ncbi:MAG TPA: PH domain-containing protein [Actinocrinis sp.]|nr:PH domain-containing protein [Actinocrinis sp.]
MPDSPNFATMDPHQAPEHIAKYLDPTEKVVFYHRFHWAMLLEPMAIIVVGIIATIIADVLHVSHRPGQRDAGWIIWGVWLLWTIATVWEVDRAKKHLNRVRGEGKAQIIAAVIIGGIGYAGFYLEKNQHFGVGGVLLIVLLVVCFWALREVGHWFDRHLILTNKRIMVVDGIVSKSVNSMPINKLTDMVYSRSALGRIFGYGLFDVESAGQDQALKLMNYVPDPDNTNLQISHLLYSSPGPPKPKNIQLSGQTSQGVNVNLTGQMDA